MLAGLALPVPHISRKPIKQDLDEYGCADEKFVHAMVQDLKGIELDRVKYGQNSPQ